MGKYRDYFSFDAMKGKLQKAVNENDYYFYLLTADEMMFDYEGLPEYIDKNRLEDFLNCTHGLVWQPKDGMHLVAPYVPRTGELNQFGYGVDIAAETLNGITLSGTVGEDIAVVYNNTANAPQWDLVTTADIFANIDQSSRVNVKFARVAPLFECLSDKQREQMKEVLKHIMDGELDTITSSGIFNGDGLDMKIDGINVIDSITTPEKIQYLQYLSQYFDIRLRRHFARRGLTLRTSDKQAQVSKDEVHGLDAVSWFYPLSKLEARRKGFDMVNKLFDLNIQVRFSELWQQEYDAYKLRVLQDDAAAEQNERKVQEDAEAAYNGSGVEDAAGSTDTAGS